MPLFCSCGLVIYEPVQQVECSFISVKVSSHLLKVNKDLIASSSFQFANTKTSVEEFDSFITFGEKSAPWMV